MRQRNCMAFLLGFSLCFVLYLTNCIFSNLNAAIRTEPSGGRDMKELEKLLQQNQELQNLVDQLKVKQNVDNTIASDVNQNGLHKTNCNHSNTADYSSHIFLTYEEEHARRKTENTAREMWFYIESALKKAEKSGPNLTATISELKKDINGYKRTMMANFEKLRKVNKAEDWRLQKSLELGDLVQRRFHYVQNPKDCRTAKKVLCDLHTQCGFGCQIHHVAFCLITAYAMERTLILNSDGWVYSSKGWGSVFEPISRSCSYDVADGSRIRWGSSIANMSQYDIIELPLLGHLNPRPDFIPLAVPADLANELSSFHGNPAAWWIGQVLHYIFRLRPDVSAEVMNAGKKMGFTNTIVGVHIRRTDKVGTEASFHSIEEYMDHVIEYYDILERTQAPVTRRVYLASDDPDVLAEARLKYPAYTFISDNYISKSAAVNGRFSENSLRGVIIDIYYLARCDFLVCTFSSNICRLVYEINQTLRGDASNNIRSLDDIFYFSGQNDHNLLVMEAHSASLEGILDLQVGDEVGIVGNHWDGYSKGVNRRTGSSGLFPSFKAEDIIVKAQMPTYPQVPRKSS